MKRRIALLLVLMMTLSTALAELTWPAITTPGQEALKAYVELVNQNLSAQGQPTINSIFEFYSGFATMGVTAQDQAFMAEQVEMTFLLNGDSIKSLQLRVSDKSRFTAIASACLQAASPAASTLESVQAEPAQYVQQVLSAPYTAFEAEVVDVAGTVPRTYYAYYPNQYQDGVDWLQLTIVFALPGSTGTAMQVTPPPQQNNFTEDDDEMYGRNTVSDGFIHFEVFLSPTPEPDSAAME